MSEGFIYILVGLLLIVIQLVIREIENKNNRQPIFLIINTWFYYILVLLFLVIGVIKIIF